MDKRKTIAREAKRIRDRTIAKVLKSPPFLMGSLVDGVSVKITLFATLREKYRVRDLNVECDGTLYDLIEKASKILGESFLDEVYDKKQGKVRGNIIFMINGRNIKDLEGTIKIKDKDVIAIFPPIAGG
jgi:molybdopterin synthase sulfur carrier subunit